jgi:hypothetical protein
MAWIAGYHDRFDSRSYERHDNWEDARAAVVEEITQRIMALYADPGADDADELEQLDALLAYFGDEVSPGQEAADDAVGLTFVLVPAHAAELTGRVDAFTVEVIR